MPESSAVGALRAVLEAKDGAHRRDGQEALVRAVEEAMGQRDHLLG